MQGITGGEGHAGVLSGKKTKVMKSGFIISTLVAIILAVVVVVGMGQISDLKKEMGALKEVKPAKSAAGRTEIGTSSRAGRIASSRSNRSSKSDRVAPEDDDPAEEKSAEQTPEQMLGNIMKLFAESDAGKRMERAGNIRKAQRLFAPLVADFDLSDDDREHFLDLAGSAANSEESLWRELMFAGEGNREEALQKWEAANEERETAMREFLNDDADWKRYEEYEARLEEHEQVQGGIRRAMEGAGVPLTPEQESQLVEVMYDTRQESGINEKWQGRGVLNQLSEPGIADRLEADMQANQEAMSPGVANVLSPQQVEAFNSSQIRMREGATEGLRWMETFRGGGGQPE